MNVLEKHWNISVVIVEFNGLFLGGNMIINLYFLMLTIVD